MPNLVFGPVMIARYSSSNWRAKIIAPKVLGDSVQLPALVVLISVNAVLQVAVVLGAILAIPLVAKTRIVLSYRWAKVLMRDPWASPT